MVDFSFFEPLNIKILDIPHNDKLSFKLLEKSGEFYTLKTDTDIKNLKVIFCGFFKAYFLIEHNNDIVLPYSEERLYWDLNKHNMNWKKGGKFSPSQSIVHGCNKKFDLDNGDVLVKIAYKKTSDLLLFKLHDYKKIEDNGKF